MTTYKIKRGDSWSRHFILPDATTGEPRDLTDAVASMQVRHRATHDLLLSLDSDPVDGDGGLTVSERSIKAVITAAQSAALAVGTTAFDVEVKFLSGEVASTETEYLSVVQDQTHV